MHNRVGRALIVLGAVLALLTAGPATTAAAKAGDTIHSGNKVCSMYVNSVGFGAYCSSGEAYLEQAHPDLERATRQQRVHPVPGLSGPPGHQLGPAPEGKKWVLRLTIVDYDLRYTNGGPDVHVERAIVPVGPDERDQCPTRGYMDRFWWTFDDSYPDPALQVKPTYIPRVNVPAYFSLTRDSSFILKNTGAPAKMNSGFYDNSHNLTMRALVSQMTIDPGDGAGRSSAGWGDPVDDADGYDETEDPYSQMGTCKHIYKRSSAPSRMACTRSTDHHVAGLVLGQPGERLADPRHGGRECGAAVACAGSAGDRWVAVGTWRTTMVKTNEPVQAARLPQRRSGSPGADRLKGFVALLAILAIVGGVPYVLLRFFGTPWPEQMPSRDVLFSELSIETVLGIIAVVIWIAWLHFVVCLIAEAVAEIRGHGLSPRIPLGGGSQAWPAG